MKKKLLSTATAATLVLGLSAGVVAPAAAAQATATSVTVVSSTTTQAPSTARSLATSSTGSLADSGLQTQGPISQDPGNTTNAVWIRYAVKAAMQVIKRTSKKTYYVITSKVSQGKTAFVNWYVKYAPNWVKKVLPGVGAAAIYDAIRWVIGL